MPALHHTESGSGEALVLLHSGGMCHEEWKPQLPALARHYRTIAPDLPGHGASPMRAERLTIGDCGRGVLDTLDALGIERAHLVGSSMGGATALWLAVHHPARVAKLVLYRVSYHKNEHTHGGTREMADGIDRFWRMRSWLDITALPAARQARVLPYIRDWVAPAAGYDGATVFHGYSQMQALREAAHAALEGARPLDFVLSPVSPMPAYPAHQASPLHDPARPFEHIAFTLPFNMSEQPALALNAGYTAAGLPIGLQLIGRRFDDAGVLALGAAWEALRPPQRPWPC